MTEQINAFVAQILGAETPESAVAIYLEAPKAVRRVAYAQIREKDAGLGKKLRAASEERRGIAARTVDGDLILAREAVKEQVVRLVGKMGEMDKRKALLGDRVVELKAQAKKFYGDEFLAELEAVIEQA